MERKLKMGMVGGGIGSFIGPVHRMAAQLDGLIEMVSGSFSSDPQRAIQSGRALFLDKNRTYETYQQMFQRERELPEEERIDFVSIVTPNNSHFSIAKAALENGFSVMCEKPMTFNLEEARLLSDLVDSTGLRFGLTHNYTGYPLVKQARHLVQKGALGKVRKVVVEYPQGWLASRLEATGQKQAEWRTDPKRAGASCCVGDIGTHAENLAEYITGLKINSLCADLSSFVSGRELDDDANVLLRFENGAKGVLHASQVSIDEENGLNIRVYGEKGGLQWSQEQPNTLILKWPDRPREYVRAGVNYENLCEQARAACRLPCGHPEGYLEAFANLYRNFAMCLIYEKMGERPKEIHEDFPKVTDGTRGMAFLQAVLESHNRGSGWVSF